MSSSFTAVFTSVRAQQNEKAVKLAFYNTAALVFVSLSGCAAVAVYYVLEPFLRPLLWAGLCGAFLYPFKWKLTQIVRGFLRSLRESHTPLVLGAMVIPFQLANKSSDVVGSFVVRRSRIFAIFCLTAVIAYVLYIIKPFYEIVWILKGSGTAVHGLLDFFYNPYLVSNFAHAVIRLCSWFMFFLLYFLQGVLVEVCIENNPLNRDKTNRKFLLFPDYILCLYHLLEIFVKLKDRSTPETT